MLITEIQQLGLPKENTETISKLYRENKDALSDKLAERSYRISKLLSTDWRVDQVFATSDNNLTKQKVIQLKFRIDENPHADSESLLRGEEQRIREVNMEMTTDDLDILINELSQAQQVMQNIHTK